MRESYTAAQKAKVALEAVRGDRRLAELASRHGVHANQIRQWEQRLLADVPHLFSDKLCAATIHAR